MKNRINNLGTTLVELLVVVAILGAIMAAMFSGYLTLLKSATITRKVAKTESDIVNTSWPLFKEIESSGFGVPATGNCTPAISVANAGSGDASRVLTIHSTAAGDKKSSGAWSYIGSGCSVTGMSDGDFVVIISPVSRERMTFTDVSSGTLNSCSSSWVGKLAYWITNGALECYETKFALRTYTSGTAPAICAAGTSKLSRSVSTTAGSTSYQPMLDCTLDLDYRFGCINKTTGSLTWRSDTSCSSSEGSLRLVRAGLILQESPKQDNQAPATITIFEDTGSTRTVNLTSAQRYYKWRKIERTITLRNLE